MEHGIGPMKYMGAILFAAYTLFAAAAVAHADEQRIAIIAGAGSSIKAITAKEVRRAYLGASIVLDGVEIKPLRNQTDKLAGEVFLQKALFMSAEAYERQLLARAFSGGSRPKAYDNLADLLDALRNDNATITFMLYETAVNTPGIRIVGNL
jgi:hypothetical protein